ncbi:MAG: SbcC/MukB-like Walker B domain-containing protein [Elusimicrobiota bacterium]|nr:SbcC/MukB-like Walker B domain-containing protein [Elusimicrobiota bacterium]
METERTELSGFRLHRFEVLNWGTFDKKVWRIEPLGHNSFLTGDIGSGKSSLVDALTTLLVPSHRIVYNRAAGAERSERDLLSYVRGDFKEDRTRSAAKVVSLRSGASYSVILGYFHNDGYDQGVTLAQVFWTKGDNAQPDKLFVIADRPLTIAEHFSNFGPEIAGLKKRLRKEADIHLFDSYVQYAREFRRRMDIRSDQALDLFYQTVALKTVENLTAFVREHMLEKPQIEERLADIRQNFDNLNRAHAAVKKAKDQIQRLGPLVADCDRWQEVSKGREEFIQCRGALHAFFAAKKIELLDERLRRLGVEKGKLADRLAQQREELDGLARKMEELRESIRAQGGGRLETIAREIERSEVERFAREQRAQAYAGHCKKLGLRSADAIESFHANKAKAQSVRAETEAEKKREEERRVDLAIEHRDREKRAQGIQAELESLQGRASNIPSHSLQIRLLISRSLDIPEESLPFVGELLQVRPEHAAWEGALERVLHNFGLSLLVPEDSYASVARFVDKTNLRGRLVYIRVRQEAGASGRPSDARHLAHKLQVKPDSAFQPWLEQELIKRFDYLCCESLDEFQRETKALTRQGQAKTPGGRHEKDDRFDIDDRSRYVLGWSNEDKVLALEQQLGSLVEDEKKDMAAIKKVLDRIAELDAKRDAARDLLGVTEFQDIDWKSSARRIADLEEERKRITAESDVLRTLQASLKESEQKHEAADAAKTALLQEQGSVNDKLTAAEELKSDAAGELAKVAEADKARLFPRLEELRAETPPDRKLTVESCDNCQTDTREWLQARIDEEDKKLDRLREKILRQMHEYKTEHPVETRDVDASLESADEFRSMLARLRGEDLPRHEERFKQLLNEGTINDIALFQNQLDKECQETREKIARINQSLRDIDYNSGTFIELVADASHDAEIREFQKQLKECLGGTLSGQDAEFYTEHKFLQVKAVIDRFNGREGMTEIDQKWAKKVTDVRNWFEFIVYERWRENNEIKETYSDSAGKSGGQKEKLAYTILASALAYQFGLGWAEKRSKAFRFVMIDEAFGRGSDESARYALTLFNQLNIQLLVVTPLQKIHVIEDYVRSVHFVHNPNQNCSMLKNLTIEQFHADRARKKQQAAAS